MIDPTAAIALALVFPILGSILGLLLLWVIVRSAVLSALKSHTHWVHDKELYHYSPWP